jgi:hypothetical protein
MKQILSPTMHDLRMECVLVQAWKKTAAHIRQHSWYADTLELDYQSLRLPSFIGELQNRLQSPLEWASTPLDVVPAPKAQRWELREEKWQPKQGEKPAKKLRPLAHVDLQDQVVATAMMMCLGDRVETAAGDPRLSPKDAEKRRQVLAYGHRLFCDANDGHLTHRWGSSKLYRQFYHDYQTFLERPKIVALQSKQTTTSGEIAIVHSDLSKFYDRVRPQMLHEKVKSLQRASDDPQFFSLFERVFNWSWREPKWPATYGSDNKIEDFSSVALPQGLVASGFFANVALRDFETALRDTIGEQLNFPGAGRVLDACYYVDDLRIVLQVEEGTAEKLIETEICKWLQKTLNAAAPGLLVEESKTKATVEGREKRFLVQQSKAAKRIQSEVSGTFDMLHGTELIGAIEGFFHTQQRYTSSETSDNNGRSGLLVGISDLRDDTAARFAAGKYRRTFRSLRPLLSGDGTDSGVAPKAEGEDEEEGRLPSQLVLSRQQLDEKAQLFAAMLIEEWVSNPGNVRLLRIALDMYPEPKFLEQILKLLRDGWSVNGRRGPLKDVRLYCLAEVFRAGATETGMVHDDDCLPNGVAVADYHELLEQEALEIFQAYISNPRSSARLPWFFMQQVFLYMGARNTYPPDIPALKTKGADRLGRYKVLARFLNGSLPSQLQERGIYLVLGVTAFGHNWLLNKTAEGIVSADFLRTLADISPDVTEKLWSLISAGASDEQGAAARSLGIMPPVSPSQTRSTVGSLAQPGHNPFYEEENLINLADALLSRPYSEWPTILTPWQVNCSLQEDSDGSHFGKVDRNSISFSDRSPSAKHLFEVPEWCESEDEQQRYKLGMVLRYALRSSVNFHAGVGGRRFSPAIRRYRTPVSHWEQQRHSSFQGRSSFGPPWLPMSSKMEDILFELLRWPGCGVSTPLRSISKIAASIRERLVELGTRRGKATKLMFLEQTATWPDKPPHKGWERPLRVGIVQSVVPDFDQYSAKLTDPELIADPELRRQQRSHLAALLEGVSQMLRVRETHRSQERQDGRVLDLLVFPELAVHPLDVETLILPFVRSYKCIVLCGLVYHAEPTLPTAPLINTCLWMVPEWTPSSGFQVRRFEQGKEHLARGESAFTPPIQGFRPVQWQVEYEWHSNTAVHRPLVLSASICYDATDLELASDLRNRNDFYIVCALNRDVGTFDRMAEGLHYHMYQAVMVVNNGQFGGSNLFFPFSETHHRQVLHLHGQPQATIAFAEISPMKLIGRPLPRPTALPPAGPDAPPEGAWKSEPAGWVNPGFES